MIFWLGSKRLFLVANITRKTPKNAFFGFCQKWHFLSKNAKNEFRWTNDAHNFFHIFEMNRKKKVVFSLFKNGHFSGVKNVQKDHFFSLLTVLTFWPHFDFLEKKHYHFTLNVFEKIENFLKKKWPFLTKSQKWRFLSYVLNKFSKFSKL